MGSEKEIPALCRFWRSLSLHLPEVRMFGLDWSVTVATFFFLSLVRHTIEFILVTVFGWPYNQFITKSAASSAAAIVHSANLVPALVTLFVAGKTYNPSKKLDDEEVWWQQTASALLQFCTGYMLYDGLMNIVWMNLTVKGTIQGDELIFLMHHVITTLYMSSTRILRAGHQSAMIAMMFGEMTNPFHNTFLVLQAAQKLDCCNGPLSQSAFRVSTFVFALCYVVIRAIAGPFICFHVTWNLVTQGRRHISWVALLIWNALIWGIMHGSIPWMIECWNMLAREIPALAVGGSQSEL